MINWWPVSDEEWERLNFPERFEQPKKMSYTILTHKGNIMSDFTPKLPEVKFNKNGYELRTDILAMAKDLVGQEYHAKYMGWEVSAERDEKTGQIVSKVNMPEFPGLEKILETAEKMYSFVNQSTNLKK